MSGTAQPHVGIISEIAYQARYDDEYNLNMFLADCLAITPLIKDKDLSTNPGSPANGDGYIVKPTGASLWVGKDNNLAFWRSATSAYVFVPPKAGMLVWVADEAKYYKFTTAWTITSL
jgi:Protein of unknown function (DUF2793)